ncbi:MAG TPA: tetratricopeptide repeat protein [Gemmatimonadales bacterium]|nr:tetratricopeptide repeat protein [Gemmatimonadales bacterium]
MRQYDEAERRIRQVLELDPNYAQAHLRLGLLRIQQQRYQDGIASLERAVDLGVFYPHAAGGLVLAHVRAGDRAAATKILRDLERRRTAGQLTPPVFIAAAYGALGDATRGLAWFNRAIDEKDIYIPENFFDPLFDPLRKNARFEQIVRRMGLTENAK